MLKKSCLVVALVAAMGVSGCSEADLSPPLAQQKRPLEPNPQFSYEPMTVGQIRTELGLHLINDPHFDPCLLGGPTSQATIVSGAAAWEAVSQVYPLSAVEPYEQLLSAPGSFAVLVDTPEGANAEFMGVPHPGTSNLSGPTTALDITWFRLGSIGDGTDPNDPCPRKETGTRGFSCGKCNLDMWSCAASDCTSCDGSGYDLTPIRDRCSLLDPFSDDRTVYELSLNQRL